MIEVVDNLWNIHAAGCWICITTNGIVKRDGLAVMGRGIAKQAAEHFPGLQKQLGWKISHFGNHVYSFLQYRILTFPTKHEWRDHSDPDLIVQSCRELRRWTAGRVYLPRPGCSNGGLDWRDVKPLLEAELPEEWFIVVSLPEG